MILLGFYISLAGEKNEATIIKETGWLSEVALNKIFEEMRANRFMPYVIVGEKNRTGALRYKAYFRPFPADLEKFYSYWGMTPRWYTTRHASMAEAGYEEIWHQSFKDAANTEIHQAVWQKITTENSQSNLNTHYADEEHERNILIGMLWRNDFEKLNRTLEAEFAQVKAGHLSSNTLYERFQSLGNLSEDFQEKFDHWVQDNKNGYAYLARGMYLNTLAWGARGGKFASETTQEQFAAFQRLSELARADLIKANIKISDCAMCAAELLRNNRALGQHDTDKSLLAAARRQAPTLHAPVLAYMNKLLPQWGGSFAAVEAFIDDIRKNHPDPVLVDQLQSRLSYYRGMAIINQDLEAARSWLEKGLNEHPYQLLVNELALLYTKQNNHQRAITLLEKSMENGNEWDIYTLEALAQSYYALGMDVKGDALIAKRDEAHRRFQNAE